MLRFLPSVSFAILPILTGALAAQQAPFAAAAIFGDHMVLPAAQAVPVHGFGTPGREVVVEPSWGDAVRTRVARSGRWSLELRTPARGESGWLTLTSGDERQQIDDVLFGDVWLASGQSNMEWKLESCDGAEQDAAAAKLPELRVFTVERATGDTPAKDVRGEWVVCTPATAPKFTAVGFYFARELLRRGKGPIGIVDSSWGGTVCQAWTSAPGLARFPEFADQLIAQSKGTAKKLVAARRELFFEQLEEAFQPLHTTEVTLPERWSQAGLDGFDGAVDYLRELQLPDDLVGVELVLELGAIDDMDVVFWNGKAVAGSRRDGVWNVPRRYVVPAEANTTGAVSLRVCVIDTGGEGGFTGRPEQMKLSRKDAPERAVPLAGSWQRARRASLSSLPKWPRSNGGPNRPAVLWNGMVQPLLPFAFTGAIWYQGESNRSNPEQYSRLFPAMIRDWRRAIGASLPFYFVQIAPFEYGKDGGALTARLRAAQAAALQLPGTGMAVTLDCGDPRDIHPRNKAPVGERLARHALAQHYGEAVDAMGPVARSARRLDDTLRVTFDEQGELQLRHGGDGFWIAAQKGPWYRAEASVEGRTVVLRSADVPEPVRVRYAWSQAPKWTLADEHGLPAPPFSMQAR
ncbi:MAG: sialate O-acetylesterase [Planctomycetota bacterium]